MQQLDHALLIPEYSYMTLHTLLFPVWGPTEPGQILPEHIVKTGTFSRVVCALFGHDFWTFKHTTHTRISDSVLNTAKHAPILRHECTHGKRQLEYVHGPWRWALRYFVSKTFRESEEAIAKAAETDKYPMFLSGPVHP